MEIDQAIEPRAIFSSDENGPKGTWVLVNHPQLDADQILWPDDYRHAGRSLYPGNGMDQSLCLNW